MPSSGSSLHTAASTTPSGWQKAGMQYYNSLACSFFQLVYDQTPPCVLISALSRAHVEYRVEQSLPCDFGTCQSQKWQVLFKSHSRCESGCGKTLFDVLVAETPSVMQGHHHKWPSLETVPVCIKTTFDLLRLAGLVMDSSIHIAVLIDLIG